MRLSATWSKVVIINSTSKGLRTQARWIQPLALLNHAIQELHLGQTGLVKCTVCLQYRLDLFPQRRKILRIRCEVVNDVGEEVRGGVDRHQCQADLRCSHIQVTTACDFVKPVQRIRLPGLVFMLPPPHFPLDNPSCYLHPLPEFLSRLQKPVNDRSEDRWPTS